MTHAKQCMRYGHLGTSCSLIKEGVVPSSELKGHLPTTKRSDKEAHVAPLDVLRQGQCMGTLCHVIAVHIAQ